MSATNRFGQPVGPEIATALPRPRPEAVPLTGRTVALVSATPAHAEGLFAAYAADDGRMWTYLPVPPPRDTHEMRARLAGMQASSDPLFFTVLDTHGTPLGTLAYLRIDPAAASIELGWITFAPCLQRTIMATEAMALMIAHAMTDLGYRRFEWKCDALNLPSRRAAERLGFTFEGVHRQAAVVKGRNRDTAWFSITDGDWPAIAARLDAWLAPANFDATGRQLTRLAAQ